MEVGELAVWPGEEPCSGAKEAPQPPLGLGRGETKRVRERRKRRVTIIKIRQERSLWPFITVPSYLPFATPSSPPLTTPPLFSPTPLHSLSLEEYGLMSPSALLGGSFRAGAGGNRDTRKY